MDSELTFGAWLKRRRRHLDLTQKALAHLAGCSVGTIRKMEADERKPSRQLAGLLAQQLDIPDDQEEAFITFARSEPYLVDVAIPVPENDEESIPVISPTAEPRTIKNNLPAENTPFVGRETELAALETLFNDQDRRLVTIVGPGGIGKTRLALAFAEHQLADQDGFETHLYKDGVFFVDLAPLAESERLTLTLAESLDLHIQGGGREKRSAKQQLIDFLLDQRLLLVLDNFEQLLSPPQNEKRDGPDSAAMLSEILGTALDVRILVTSRERLNLQIEQVYPLQGLIFPDREIPEDAAAYSAMKLFIQSAQSVRPGFVLEADDWTYLTKICRLVEGMPLALELAAVWVDVLSLADIGAEIQQSLDFLEAELRDLPSRQRSLRATFDSSWRKLDEWEQSIFAQLSVFRGGFTRQAAQAVTGATLRQLSRLANKSFIQYKKRQNRYQIHELLRQYGAERLKWNAESETGLQDRHSVYYCQFLADLTDDQKGAGQPQALVAIEADIENVRLAWNHAIARQDLAAIDISAESLHRFYYNRGPWVQAVKDFEKAIAGLRTGELVGERGIVLGRLLAFLGRFYNEGMSQPERASQALKQSLDLLQRSGAREQKLYPLLFLADLATSLEERNQLFQEGLDLARELDDQWAIGHALLYMANGAQKAGDYEQAERRYQQALAQFRKTDDPGGIMVSSIHLSRNTAMRGRYQEALSLGREALIQARKFDPHFPFMGLWSLGRALYAAGDYAEAEKLFRQGLALSMEYDRDYRITVFLFYLGEIAFNTGDHALATQRYQEGLAKAVKTHDLEFVARHQAALGRLSAVQNERFQAREHLKMALVTAIPLSQPPLLLAIFSTAAEIFVAEGNLEYAALLAAFVINHPASEALVKERAEEHLTHLLEQFSADDLTQISQRSWERGLDDLAAQLLTDLEPP